MMDSLDRSLWVDLVGIPFKTLGRDEKGIDCFGLVMKIYARRGIMVPDVKYGLSDEERRDALLSPQNLTGWKRCDLKPGCVITFKKSGFVQHCGVCINEEKFIHSSEDHGGVVIGRLSGSVDLANKMTAGYFDYAV